MKQLRVIYIVALLLSVLAVRAQEETEEPEEELTANERYSIAEDLFIRGKTDSVMVILRPALTMKSLRKMNKGTRSNICRLAVRTSLLLDKTEDARLYTKRLLTFEPDYEFNVSDDYRKFKILLESMQIVPRFMLGVKLGGNTSFVSVLKEYQFYEIGEVVNGEFINAHPSGSYKNSYKGFQLGLSASYSLTKSMYLVFEPVFSQHTFDYSIDYGPILQIDNNNFSVTLSYFDLPLGVRNYFLLNQTWRPYIAAGAYWRQLASAGKEAQNASADITDLLNSSDYGYWVGGGISYTQKKYSVNLDVIYASGMNLVNHTDRRYVFDQQTDLFMFKNGDLADDIKLRDIQVSLSFVIFLSHKVFFKK